MSRPPLQKKRKQYPASSTPLPAKLIEKGFTLDPDAQARLDRYSKWENNQLSQIKAKKRGNYKKHESKKKKEVDEKPIVNGSIVLPLKPNAKRLAADIFDIGTALLDEFDLLGMQFLTYLDREKLQVDDTTLKPNCLSDEEAERFSQVFTENRPFRTDAFTFDGIAQLLGLSTGAPMEEEDNDEEESDVMQNDVIESPCFAALAWLTIELIPLPIHVRLKEMYVQQAFAVALHLRSEESDVLRLWKHVVLTSNRLRQDLVDYKAYATTTTSAGGEEQKEEKQVTEKKRSKLSTPHTASSRKQAKVQ